MSKLLVKNESQIGENSKTKKNRKNLEDFQVLQSFKTTI